MKVRQSKDKYCIGTNIRELRISHKLTQEKVVAKLQLMGLDMSRGTYSQIECGLSNIRVEEILALCKIFDCDVNTIFMNMTL